MSPVTLIHIDVLIRLCTRMPGARMLVCRYACVHICVRTGTLACKISCVQSCMYEGMRVYVSQIIFAVCI